MANKVEVEIVGKDSTSVAVRGATANMRVLGSTFNQVGAIASRFGNQTLGAVVGSLAQGVVHTRQLTQELGKSRLAFAAIGAAAATAGVSIGAALHDLLDLANAKGTAQLLSLHKIQNEAVMERLALVNALAAAEQRVNLELAKRIAALEEIDSLSEFEKSTARLDVQKAAEAKIFELKRKYIEDLPKLQEQADSKYEEAQKSITEFEAKERERRHQKLLEGLDAEIEEEQKAKEEKERLLKEETEAYIADWQRRNTGLIEALRTAEELWNHSLGNIKQALLSFSGAAAISVSDGLGNALADVATRAKSAEEAMKDFGKQLLGLLVKSATQMVINALLAKTLQAAAGVTSAIVAQGIASAWAPAAALVSLASYGANAIPAAAALTSTTTLANSLALIRGQAHSGLDTVPADGTYVLKQGEMVVDSGTSEEVRQNLLGGGAGSTVVNVNVGELPLARLLLQMSRDGRLEISQKAIAA